MCSVISSKTLPMVGIVFALTAAATDARAFEVIGHRGAGGLGPENTIIGFRAGVQAGATTVEADVTMTRDLQMIVRHDLRVSVCQGPYQHRFFKNLTLRQVRRLDCGAGAHVPTLDQVYRAVPGARLLVEAKIDPYEPRDTYAPAVVARHLVDAIRAAHGLRRTTVQSFDWRVLREVARRAPRLRLQALASDLTLFPGSRWLGGVRVRSQPFRSGLASAVQRAGFDALAVPSSKVTPTLVGAAHGRRLAIVAFTVDRPDRMEQLIAAGVDGIITNYPDRLSALRR